MQSWILLLVVVAACGDDGVDEPDTSARTAHCERARDHLVDLRLAGSEALGKIELEKHRVALTSALSTQFMENCTTRMSEEHLSCLLVAADSDGVLRATIVTA